MIQPIDHVPSGSDPTDPTEPAWVSWRLWGEFQLVRGTHSTDPEEFWHGVTPPIIVKRGGFLDVTLIFPTRSGHGGYAAMAD